MSTPSISRMCLVSEKWDDKTSEYLFGYLHISYKYVYIYIHMYIYTNMFSNAETDRMPKDDELPELPMMIPIPDQPHREISLFLQV